MEKILGSKKIKHYLNKHWFQLMVFGFLIFIIMRKDFSFQLNMNNPDKVEEPSFHPLESKQIKKEELLTQNAKGHSIKKSDSGILERFGLSFLGGGTKTKSRSEFSKVDEKTIGSYLKRFAHVAINERKKYGVPSSIILANSLFHSFAGTRAIAHSGNNHFAIACSSDWSGDKKNIHNKCYRKYENAWTSFRDHSLIVTSGKYTKLLQYGTTDYRSWAKGIDNEGFSEFTDLEKNLIKIIEKYELYLLDVQ